MVLTDGEKLMSVFKNETTTNLFRKFCNEKAELFDDAGRNKNSIWIADIMYMITKDKYEIPDSTKRKRFLLSMENKKNIKKKIKEITPYIDVFYGKKVFNSSSLKTKKINKNIKLALIYLLSDEYDDVNNLTKNEYKRIRKIIKNMLKKWDRKSNPHRNKTTQEALEKIQVMFDKENEKVD